MSETTNDAVVRLVEDAYGTHGYKEAPTVMYLAREVVTLRTQLAAARERVEKLPRYDYDYLQERVSHNPEGNYVRRIAVLAALEVGG